MREMEKRPPSRRSTYVYNLAGICALLAAIGLLGYGIATRWWLRWSFDERWARAAIEKAAPIVEALERCRQEQGMYPSALVDLVPAYLPAILDPPLHPSSGGDRWCYGIEPSGEFRLWVDAVHWVSSFDALVLRPSRTYPPAWRERHSFDVDGWLYVVGFSRFVRTGVEVR
jgi:hypothetical protein